MVDKTSAPVNTNLSKQEHKETFFVRGSDFVTENTGFIKDFYKISSCIGRGAYGEVRKCLHKETKALRAVKIINKKFLEEDEKDKL